MTFVGAPETLGDLRTASRRLKAPQLMNIVPLEGRRS